MAIISTYQSSIDLDIHSWELTRHTQLIQLNTKFNNDLSIFSSIRFPANKFIAIIDGLGHSHHSNVQVKFGRFQIHIFVYGGGWWFWHMFVLLFKNKVKVACSCSLPVAKSHHINNTRWKCVNKNRSFEQKNKNEMFRLVVWSKTSSPSFFRHIHRPYKPQSPLLMYEDELHPWTRPASM